MKNSKPTWLIALIRPMRNKTDYDAVRADTSVLGWMRNLAREPEIDWIFS